MSLINCPECGKEISDKVVTCIHCGYPIQNQTVEVTSAVANTDDSVPSLSASELKKRPNKIIITIAAVAILAVCVFASVIPNAIKKKNYAEAMALLEQGKYDSAKVLLDELSGYKETDTIQEQIRYESIAYSCINELKKYLKDPDSYTPYEITFFYLNFEIAEIQYPTCIMHFGAKNGFGGYNPGYAIFIYKGESKQYELLGITNTLDEEELEEDDSEYYIKLGTLTLIETYFDYGREIGNIDMDRIKTVIKSEAYSKIEIIN